MVAKDRQSATSSPSPKVEVGEIDTRAPFQSVKDAVTLFGEGAFSGEKPAIKKTKPHSAERVLANETQLHLAQKELNKLKEQLKNAETTKTQALVELEKAKETLEDLTNKVTSLSESKESAIDEQTGREQNGKGGGLRSPLEAQRGTVDVSLKRIDQEQLSHDDGEALEVDCLPAVVVKVRNHSHGRVGDVRYLGHGPFEEREEGGVVESPF